MVDGAKRNSVGAFRQLYDTLYKIETNPFGSASYPGYERPITADSGILLAAEAIRKSFGRKYYLPLYKYPILIDFGTPDGQICVIHPSNYISYTSKKEGEE